MTRKIKLDRPTKPEATLKSGYLGATAKGIIEVVVNEIKVAEATQRKLVSAHVDKLASSFSRAALGIPLLNFIDGAYLAVDGQHRVAVMKKLGFGREKILCEVWEGMTTPQMAAAFLERNANRNVASFDKFRIGCEAGQERELQIYLMASDRQLRITRIDPLRHDPWPRPALEP